MKKFNITNVLLGVILAIFDGFLVHLSGNSISVATALLIYSIITFSSKD